MRPGLQQRLQIRLPALALPAAGHSLRARVVDLAEIQVVTQPKRQVGPLIGHGLENGVMAVAVRLPRPVESGVVTVITAARQKAEIWRIAAPLPQRLGGKTIDLCWRLQLAIQPQVVSVLHPRLQAEQRHLAGKLLFRHQGNPCAAALGRRIVGGPVVHTGDTD